MELERKKPGWPSERMYLSIQGSPNWEMNCHCHLIFRRHVKPSSAHFTQVQKCLKALQISCDTGCFVRKTRKVSPCHQQQIAFITTLKGVLPSIGMEAVLGRSASPTNTFWSRMGVTRWKLGSPPNVKGICPEGIARAYNLQVQEIWMQTKWYLPL